MFKDMVKCVHIYKNSYILITIFIITLYEFIVDVPAFKKEGLSKDMKVTVILCSGLLVFTISILILFRVC